MTGLARVLNRGFAQCTSNTDKDLMKHIFMEQFKNCPLHSAKLAFLKAVEYDPPSWSNARNELQAMYMVNSLSTKCVKRVGPLVEALAIVVRELMLINKRADVTDAGKGINTTLQTMNKLGQNPTQQNKIVDAFTTWRSEVATNLQGTNHKAWESLITALDEFKEQVNASDCNDKEMPILKSIVDMIMRDCPYPALCDNLVSNGFI